MRLVRHLSPTAPLRETGRRTARAAIAVLGGAGLLLAGAVALPASAATGQSAAGTRAAAPTTTRTTTTEHTTGTTSTGGKVTCSWVPSYVSSVMPTAIAFHLPDMSRCITPGPSSSTITVYLNQVDAQAHTNPVGSATAMWGLDGIVTGLNPDTDYWWVGTDQGGWVRGPVHTLKAIVTTSTSTSSGPVCTPAPTGVDTITSTSISFLRRTSASCPVTGQVTVDVYARRADAEARRRQVGHVTGAAGTVLVVGGLKPNKKYWYVSSDVATVRGPVLTLKAGATTSTTTPTCTASYRVVDAWSGGFVAEVAVTATTPISAWRLTMHTATGDTIEQAWGAVVTPSSVFWTSTGSNTKPPSGLLAYSAVNLPGAGALAASQTYRWGVLGSIATGVTPSVMSVTCIAS